MSKEQQDITKAWKNYQQNLKKIDKRQKQWQKKGKPKLKRHLKDLASKNNLPAEVGTEEKVINMEAVFLVFGKVPSGMENRISKEITRPYAKDLGGLFYSQIYNGKVSAWFRSPVIEELMQRNPPKVLGIYEPQDLSLEQIENHLLEFLNRLSEWENQDNSRTEIGF